MMPPLLVTICYLLITIAAHFVVDAADLQDFVDEIINANGGHSESDSREQPTNNTLVIVIPGSGSEPEANEDKSKDDSQPYGNHAATEDYIFQNKTRIFNDRRMASIDNKSTKKRRGKRLWTGTPKPKLKDRSDHLRRLKEIKEHMEQYFTSTLYLYNEAKRIRQTNVIRDDLRLMAEDVANPKYEALRKKVLECGRPPKVKAPKDIWKKPNNVVIHIQKDPINDNVPN